MYSTTLLVTILCASHVCSSVVYRREADPAKDGAGDGMEQVPGDLQPVSYTHDTGPYGMIIPGSNRTVIPDISTASPETTEDGQNGGGVTDLPGDSGYGSGDSGYGSGDSGYGSGDSGYESGDSGYEPGDSSYGAGDSGYGPGSAEPPGEPRESTPPSGW